MSINYHDQDNYADLAESISTAGRPVHIKGKKKNKAKPKNPHKYPSTYTEKQSKDEEVYGP